MVLTGLVSLTSVQTAAGAQCADKHFDLCLARVFLGSVLILLRIPGSDTQKAR